MPHVQDHNQVVREEFTRQAVAYAANPSIADPERIARLVQAVSPSADARVLEVATGPGYVAMGFAAVAREVVGIDLTEAPLAIAEQRRQEQGLHNVRFQLADAARLPFADGEFDVVVCRLAFHHFAQPPGMLSEMVRVCAPHGTVAVEDIVVSEHPARGAYPAERAVEVRRLIEQDAREDLSGTRPFQTDEGQWCFTQHTAIVVGRKLN